jgi:hypothetical protein
MSDILQPFGVLCWTEPPEYRANTMDRCDPNMSIGGSAAWNTLVRGFPGIPHGYDHKPPSAP